MLHVSQLDGYYGKIHALRGINLSIEQGEIVAILGRNGAGKSTLAKALMGLIDRKGSIKFLGQETITSQTHQLARLGFGYVPENREIFPTLTVRENLLVGAKPNQKNYHALADQFLSRFSNLSNRTHIKAKVLSGGEQQILSILRTLMGQPKMIIVDEPTEGLAPLIVNQLKELLQETAKQGVTIILIEQKLSIALAIAHKVYLMGQGEVVFEGTPDHLKAQPDIVSEWLTV